MQLSNVYQAAQFHHDLSAKPEQIRHNLTVAWKTAAYRRGRTP